MDLRPYITPILKWWWLLIIAAVLAVGTSYYFIKDQPVAYTAKSTLLMGRALNDPNPTGNEFFLNQQLSSLYISLATREPTRKATMDRLGLTWLPKYTVKPSGNNQFIEIAVTDDDPLVAQSVANELANQLISVSPGGGESVDQSRQKFVDEQIVIIQQQIVTTDEEIAAKRIEMGNLTSASDLVSAQEDLRALETKIAALRTNYANLIASSRSVMSNTLQLIEPAELPTKPVGLSKTLIMILAGLIGFTLAIGAAYLIEFLDTTIKTPDDIKKILKLNSIGFLMDLGRKFKEKPYIYYHPNTQLAEAYRSLRVNLEYSQRETHVKTLMITSPSPGDGKSTVAINLALSMVQSGRRVILVDADLRRPSLHRYLNLPESSGVVDVLSNPALLEEDLLVNWNDTDLLVLPAGECVNDQMIDHLMAPDKVRRLVTELRNRADIVIFDSSPFLISDAILMASQVDGVVLVMRPGVTQKEMAVSLVEELKDSHARLLGIVLNRIPVGRIGFGEYYRYHSPYYYNYKRSSNGKVKKTDIPAIATPETEEIEPVATVDQRSIIDDTDTSDS